MPELVAVDATPEIVRRFMAKCRFPGDKTADSCWLWVAYQTCQGYGQFWFRGMAWRAHRVAWTLFRGEIRRGMEIDHLCFNPDCVNPAHLEEVTKDENLRRRRLTSERQRWDTGRSPRRPSLL